MPSRYTFDTYSADWPHQFSSAAAELHILLGNSLVAIHHIGSTAVPGLAAKPIIDIMPLVEDIAAVDTLADRFTSAGYQARGAYGLPGRRYFTLDRNGARVRNVHIFQRDNPEARRHLAFRDYLRAHPAVRDEYAAVKARAYAAHPADIHAYNDAKDAWIKRTEQLALAWATSRQE